MIFLALLAAIFFVYIFQYKAFGKHTFDDIEYDVKVSGEEVFEGEDIFVYEEISNGKTLPVPYAKVDTTLPNGLYFRITENERGAVRDSLRSHVQSVFVLRSREKVRRRWRVTCKTRGVYTVGGAVVVANDLFGMNPISKGFECTPNKDNTIVVLPRPVNIAEHFTSSQYNTGDFVTNSGLLTDPLRIAGARDYTTFDPMNKINWKQTAVHGKLMVNCEEYTRPHRFNILLNMNSRDIEKDAKRPGSPDDIERCVTVCASILDRVSSENVPVRIIANTPPETISDEFRASDEETGRDIMMTPPYEGKRDMITALRLLAALKMEMSCPIERMLDYVLEHKEGFTESGNLIVVSSYISERMIVFHNQMEHEGVKVIFYVTTTNRNAAIIPQNVEVYYYYNA